MNDLCLQMFHDILKFACKQILEYQQKENSHREMCTYSNLTGWAIMKKSDKVSNIIM